MTIDEIKNRPRQFRLNVLRAGAVGHKVGDELEFAGESIPWKTINLVSKSNGQVNAFNRSDVSELTPLSFGGRGIAIGDEVQCEGMEGWRQVHGFHWYDGQWILDVSDGDLESLCECFDQDDIFAHRTPHDAPPRTVEQVLASLPDADKAVVMRALNR